MTLNGIIAQFDSLKPNVFSEELKRQWLSEVDYFIILMRNHYVLSDDEQVIVDDWEPYIDAEGTTNLLVDVPYTDMYIHYLSSKVDYNQMDIHRYQNSLAMYQDVYNSYARKFNRSHKAKLTSIVGYGYKEKEVKEWQVP